MDGAIRLFLFACGSEAIGADITMQAKRSRLVHHCVRVKEDKDRRIFEFLGESANDFLHWGSKIERSAFLEQVCSRAYASGHVRKERVVIPEPTK